MGLFQRNQMKRQKNNGLNINVMKKTMLLLCGICIFLTGFSQSKYGYSRFGLNSKMTYQPIRVNDELRLEQDKNGVFILSEPRNHVKITFKFFGSENGKYVYKGTGRIAFEAYNTVILSANIKLGNLLKGAGNSIESPFDDKYKIQIMFSHVINGHVSKLENIDYYIIENPTQTEMDAERKREREKLVQEQKLKQLLSILSDTIDRHVAELFYDKYKADWYQVQGNSKKIINYMACIDTVGFKIIGIERNTIDKELYSKYLKCERKFSKLPNNEYGCIYEHGLFFKKQIEVPVSVEYYKLMVTIKKSGIKYSTNEGVFSKTISEENIPNVIKSKVISEVQEKKGWCVIHCAVCNGRLKYFDIYTDKLK